MSHLRDKVTGQDKGQRTTQRRVKENEMIERVY